jgi:hypothetical protein
VVAELSGWRHLAASGTCIRDKASTACLSAGAVGNEPSIKSGSREDDFYIQILACTNRCYVLPGQTVRRLAPELRILAAGVGRSGLNGRRCVYSVKVPSGKVCEWALGTQ